MRGTILNGLRAGASKLLRDQRGNAMMLTAAAIIPVIGIVGSAVDIGRAYMAQLRLQQACDAGVLAGRPTERDAILGPLIETGRRHGLDVATIDALYRTTPH